MKECSKDRKWIIWYSMSPVGGLKDSGRMEGVRKATNSCAREESYTIFWLMDILKY